MQKWMSGSAWGSSGYLCDNRYGVLPKIGKKVQFYPKYYFIFCAFGFTDFWALCNNPTTHCKILIFILKRWKVRKREKELYCTFSRRKKKCKLFYVPSHLDFWRDRRWCLETHQSDSSSFLSNSQDGRDSALKHRKKTFWWILCKNQIYLSYA